MEGCDDEDVLTIACSDEDLDTHFSHEAVKEKHNKIENAITDLLGLPQQKQSQNVFPYVQFQSYKFGVCLSNNFGSGEATMLCKNQGYHCGLPNFNNLINPANIENGVDVEVSCPPEADSLSSCHLQLDQSCQQVAHITCFSSCPALISERNLGLSNSWELQFQPSVDQCSTEIFVHQDKLENRINIGSSVTVTTSVIIDKSLYDTSNFPLVSTEEHKDKNCLPLMMMKICQCVPWQYNHHLDYPTCYDGDNINCSQSVKSVWNSVGADCDEAVEAAQQFFRIKLNKDDICLGCSENSDISIKYQTKQSPSSTCSDDQRITITMDRENSQTYTREVAYSWITILAGLGGIWSFITGISICSVVELLYWLCFTILNHKNVMKTGDSESLSYQEEGDEKSQIGIKLYDIKSNGEEESIDINMKNQMS